MAKSLKEMEKLGFNIIGLKRSWNNSINSKKSKFGLKILKHISNDISICEKYNL